MKLTESNIVILAQNLNPSIFSQLWLIKTGIITDAENITGSFFTPAAVSLVTPSFELIVVPERLQVTLKQLDRDSQQGLINDTCGRIAKELPHTPYTAIGFNLDWVVEVEDELEYKKAMKAIFLSTENPIASFFASDNSTFGMTLAKDAIGMRLTLTLTEVKNIKTGVLGLMFKFNFHHPIGDHEKNMDGILTILNKWTEARQTTEIMIAEGIKTWNFLRA